MVVNDVKAIKALGEVDPIERLSDVVDLIQRTLDLVGVGLLKQSYNFARETEPGAQNSVTSRPRRTSASVKVLTTDSTPP